MGLLKKFELALLLPLLALVPGGAHAASYVDVLDLPSAPSALSVRSPLVGITRAGERLVSVGQRGHILYSDDAGKQWTQASVPLGERERAITASPSCRGGDPSP